MENKCTICGQELNADDVVFTVGENEGICCECATKQALEARNENREIEITVGEYNEAWNLCQWCDELFPESELKEEIDLGKLCDHCILGIASRGEKLYIEN